MKRLKAFNFRVTREQKMKLREAAKKQNISVSAVIRNLINTTLGTEESVTDEQRDHLGTCKQCGAIAVHYHSCPLSPHFRY